MSEHNTTIPGKEPCPGSLRWSAFGANYQDTQCSNSLSWGGDWPPANVLCDSDDELAASTIPCPFCDPKGFRDYLWTDGRHVPVWEFDRTSVPGDVEIHFHDGDTLWFSATHPERGEQKVIAVPRAAA